MVKKIKFNISIIITNYNGVGLLRNNLSKVMKAFKNKGNNILEVIIVDDASTDESVRFVRKNYPEVKLVVPKKNRRFPATTNTGCRTAKGELVCLLNNDVSPSEDFLKSVYKHFDDEKVFGVSLSEKGYSWSKGAFEDGFIVHKSGKRTRKEHETFTVSGGSGVFRRDIWMKLKGLDEVLFTPFYWEDLDIGYRALKRGYKLLWEPKAIVTHEHESTNKHFKKKYKSRIQERNQLLFIWKNLTSTRLIKKHKSGLRKRILKHPGYLRIFLMALIKLPSVMKLRRIEKKESTVSDESIFARFKK